MSSLDSTIKNALSVQDLELAQAITALKKNPEKLNAFISARRKELYNTVTNEHSDTFQKVHGDLQRSSDTQNNVLYYFIRNKDLDKVESAVFEKAETDAINARHDSELAKRQVEVNEWTSNNKMDTLFVFQMILIALSLSAPLLYLHKTGVLPMSVFIGVTSLLFLAILFTIIVRAQYTNFTRDNHYWNRRKFATMGGPPVIPTSCVSVAGVVSSATDAASSLTSGANSLYNSGLSIGSQLGNIRV